MVLVKHVHKATAKHTPVNGLQQIGGGSRAFATSANILELLFVRGAKTRGLVVLGDPSEGPSCFQDLTLVRVNLVVTRASSGVVLHELELALHRAFKAVNLSRELVELLHYQVMF